MAVRNSDRSLGDRIPFSFKKALAVSLFVHLSVFIYFLLLKFEPIQTPDKKEHIALEIIEKKTEKTKQVKALSGQGRSKESLKLKLLSPKINFYSYGQPVHSEKIAADGDTYLTSELKDDEKAAWGSGGGTFARVKDYLLYKKIYDNIDSILFFPGLLVRQRIQGIVNARMVIGPTGACQWQKTQIHGTNSYLQLYVLHLIREACKQSYWDFIKEREITNVDLSFQFELTEHYNKSLADKNRFIVGNTLLFYRNSQSSIMEWEFGPFKGIFPVPSVYLNVPWIKENWDRLIGADDPIIVFKKEFGS